MRERMINNLKRHWPFIYRDAVDIKEHDWDTLLILTNDGERFMYDDVEHDIRRIPNCRDEMDKNQCCYEFGDRLLRIMRHKGISQTELSVMTGISQPQLSLYIRGKRSPSFYAVDKIAYALDCSLDDLRYIW